MTLAAIAAVCYAASFCLPALEGQPRQPYLGGTLYGFMAFIFGIGAFLALCPIWIANPAFWLGLVFLVEDMPRTALASALVALAFSAGYGHGLLQTNRVEPLIGYHLWVLSMAFVAFGSVVVIVLAMLRSLVGAKPAQAGEARPGA